MSVHHEGSSQVRSSDEGVPLTRGRGVLRQRKPLPLPLAPRPCAWLPGAGKRALSAQWVYAPISIAHGIGLLELLGNPNNTSLYAAYSLASTNHPPPPREGARTGPGDPSAEITGEVFWVRSGMGL
jgi:hypothetical protein